MGHSKSAFAFFLDSSFLFNFSINNTWRFLLL
jgi:hypothetical protein